MPAGKYRRLLPYIVRQWPALVVIVALNLAASAVAVLQPWPMKLLVDHALGSSPISASLRSVFRAITLEPSPAGLLLAAAISSLALFALNSALTAVLTWSWTAASQQMTKGLAADLFHRLQRLSLRFHSQRSVGDSLSRLTGDTWCVGAVSEGLLVAPIRYVFTLFAIGAVAWSLDPVVAVIAIAVAPVLVISASVFGRRLKQRGQLQRQAHSRLLSFVQQTLAAIPVVQAFGTEARNTEQYRRLAERSDDLAQHGILLKNAHGLVGGLTTTLGTTALLFVGGQRVLAGALTVGGLLVMLTYLRSIQDALKGILSTYTNLKAAEMSIERVLEVLDAEERVEEVSGAAVLPARSARGAIRFEGVSFGYEPEQPVLRDVWLEADPGETVALVGPTGAGKSTLVSLIPRFFDPGEGRITLDGVDVRQIALRSLRAQISLVLQEPFLLPLSVAENIAYGRPDASREEIRAAAVAACADDFIRRLPQGYDTVIGERGATLSGGQRQRLSIARALLKDAPVLILDEPTSALDARTEALLLEALERLMKGRTTFVIAHRLSTIRNASRIAVLEEGRIVESGTHAELIASCGAYHGLHTLQFGQEIAA